MTPKYTHKFYIKEEFEFDGVPFKAGLFLSFWLEWRGEELFYVNPLYRSGPIPKTELDNLVNRGKLVLPKDP